MHLPSPARWALHLLSRGITPYLLLLLLTAHASAQTLPAAPASADGGSGSGRASAQVEAAYEQLGRLSEAVQRVPSTSDISQRGSARTCPRAC
ncbi:hypothetical protein [Hymenobacter terrenus]|uniref:hypothetical protein n=1 Tax=Hymenobacter terrenus TaxID=1629124 RepID=UPI000AA11D4B|nr:hypothetical protein [Hymenobacter terrenus]